MPVRKSDTQFERRQKYLQTLAGWQNLLEHFELNDHAFAYIPLLLPNDLWARVCEVSLENFLSRQDKNLYKIDCQTPDELKNIAVTLFALEIDEDTEAIWIVAPIGSGETFLTQWSQAWREGMARLNQYRNPFREKFPVTILFVGAEWIQEITRNMAPDLWSIRRTVIRVNPEIDFSDATDKKTEPIQSEPIFEHGQGVDAEFALQEAERLRGKEGLELHLAKVLYRAASGFLDIKEYKKALKAINEAIKIYKNKLTENPDEGNQEDIEFQLADSLFIKGFLLAERGDSQTEAEKNYREAIKLDPNYTSAYYNLGVLLDQDKSRLADAEAMYRRAIEVNPNYADAYNNLGVLLDEDERPWNEAEELYRKAIEINPNYADAYYNLGGLLAKDENRWSEAEEMYRKVIEINPNYADAYYNLGILLAKDENRWAEAEEMYRKAIEINPNYADAYYNLGILLFTDENRLKEAEELYRKAIKINPSYTNAYYNLGILLAKDENRLAEAEEMYRKVIEINPNYADAYINLGILLFKDGNRQDEAEAMYRRALEVNPNYADAYYNLGTLLDKDETRWAEAEAMYRKALEVNPNLANAYGNLALLKAKSVGEEAKDEIIECLRKCVELNPAYKEWAKWGADYDFIRDDARFAEIVGEQA
ncbi:MAG: tetratricopeptide repeat protein [Pyrinomonadaceae bacterium]